VDISGGRVYLDNQATTPVDPRVLDAMLPFFGPKFGNAASRSHSFGWEAEKAVQAARQSIAALAGAAPREIVFTSGATESNNLALKGAAERYRSQGDHLVTVATEHHAVLDTVRWLGRNGWRTTVLIPQADGLVDLAALESAILPETVVVSVMYANNEIGVIQPIREIGEICRRRGALLHCDAAQAFGKIPIDVARDGIDLMALSAHKLYGPKGIGALYVRRRVEIASQMEGGSHELGMRSGTLNVPAIVGFGEACSIAAREMAEEEVRVGGLRDRLLERLRAELDGVELNGAVEPRLAGNLNVSFDGVANESLMMSVPEIAISTGSACSSATVEPSHVLMALGLSEERIRSAIRIGIGRFNTPEEIDYSAGRLVAAVQRLRALRPA
jgi:cysteine desulfurase